MKMKIKKDLNNMLSINFSNLTIAGYWDSTYVTQIIDNILQCRNDSSKIKPTARAMMRL